MAGGSTRPFETEEEPSFSNVHPASTGEGQPLLQKQKIKQLDEIPAPTAYRKAATIFEGMICVSHTGPPRQDPISYLDFECTPEDEVGAEIVISFPIESRHSHRESLAQDKGSVEVSEDELKRRDLLARLSKAGLMYVARLAEDGDEWQKEDRGD